MKKMLRYLFIGIIFPLLVHYVFYFQFTPNYSQDLFSEGTFTSFYGTQVYASRVLGKELHLWTYHKLYKWDKMKGFRENEYSSRRLKPLDPNADAVFYLTYFFISAIFSVLTALVLLYLFDHRSLFPAEETYKDLVICFFILLVGFTQFVVTPYDTVGYFFQAASIMLFVKFLQKGSLILYALLCVFIVLATTNRETSMMILSFMAAVYFTMHGFRAGWIKKMIVPALAFLIPYLWLKFQSSDGTNFTDRSQLVSNFNLLHPYSMMGILFSCFAVYLIYRLNRNRPVIIHSFLFFSLPYIVIFLVTGIIVEYRLWLPLMEGAFVLAFIDLNQLTYSIKRPATPRDN